MLLAQPPSYLSINLGLVNEYIYTHPVRYLILVDEVEVHEHSYHDLEGLIVGKLQVVELVAAGRNKEIRMNCFIKFKGFFSASFL